MGIVALVQALSGSTFARPNGLRLVQREIVAMVFVLINDLGHWGMVYALLTVPGPVALLLAFAALMLAGDLVKLVFLRVHDFKVRDRSQATLYGLTLVYVAGYLAILLLEWLG